MPAYLRPRAAVVRAEEAAADEARARAAAEQEEFERELLHLRWEVKKLKLEHELWCFEQKYSPSQPRVPAGSPDGGQWTSGGDGAGATAAQQDQGRLPTASDQPRRSDLQELEALAGDPVVRTRIDEAWRASNSPDSRRQEHGFWISRNETTGEIFTRPFSNAGSAANITPGSVPGDAIAFFHTHPTPPEAGYRPGPSRADEAYAADTGLAGILRSHNGMYYFGPSLGPRRGR
jgi:hypothetical protein